MPENSELLEISREGNWMTFGVRLDEAMRDPARFGLTQGDEVLGEVARLRGQSPSTLVTPLQTVRFLAAHYPDMLASRDDRIGMTHVRLLSQLEELDTPEKAELKDKVVNGCISQRELAQRVAEARKRARSSGALPETRRKRFDGAARAKEFEDDVLAYLRQNLTRFVGRPDASLRSGADLLPIGTDAIAVVGDVPVAAFEIRSPRVVVPRRALIEALGVNALIRKFVPEVWLIAPLSWANNLFWLGSVAKVMDIEGLRFAVFDDRSPRATIHEVRFRDPLPDDLRDLPED